MKTIIVALCIASATALRQRSNMGLTVRGGAEEGADDAAEDSLFGGDDKASAGSSMQDMMGQMGAQMPPGFDGSPAGVSRRRRLWRGGRGGGSAARARGTRVVVVAVAGERGASSAFFTRVSRAGNPAEYEAAMEQFLDSPMMKEFLENPEKLEESRLALLNNPMAMQMMKQMPGFEEIINDKDKFQQRMLESKTQFDAMREAASKDKAAEAAAASEFED